MNNKKIAIFHNFMDNIGGAEMVTLYLAREFDADIFTTNIDESQISKMGFSDVGPRIKSLGKIPKMAPFRHQLALWKFRRLNLGTRYDFYIISGDWAISGAVNNHPNLWYVHGPINELWAFKDYVKNNILTWWKKPIFNMWVWLNRNLTLKYSKSVDAWICNSNNTKERIKKYYKANATVINPPVDTSKHTPLSSQNFWLSVNRLSVPKRIEIQMKAFAKLPEEKLVIVGSYERGTKQFEDYKKYLESIKPDNVEIISWVDFEEIISLYNTCKGFVTTAKDEDFGMTPVEAMASGKPVIAPNEGGYKETVLDGKTGILINNINNELLRSAILEINKRLADNPKAFKRNCIDRAKEYNIDIFIEKIKSLI